jgi:uncharacterized protein
VETEGKLVPPEVKLSSTPKPAMASAIHTFRQALGEKAAPDYVIHSGDIRLSLGNGVTVLPFGKL